MRDALKAVGQFLKVDKISKAVAAFVAAFLVTDLGLDAAVAEAVGSSLAIAVTVYLSPKNAEPEPEFEPPTFEGSD